MLWYSTDIQMFVTIRKHEYWKENKTKQNNKPRIRVMNIKCIVRNNYFLPI